MAEEQKPVTFQFKGLHWYFIYMPIVITPCEIFLLVGAIHDGSLTLWFFFLFGFLLFYVIGSYLSVRSASDIVVDDKSISRRFAGRIIQALSWDNVQEVTVVRAPSKDYPNRIGVNFMPKVVPRRSFTRTGRIVFATDPLRTGTLSGLINIINQRIAEHDIKVAWWVNGIKTYTDHVEWPLPDMKAKRSQTW